jgi:hypothetical protein
MRASCLRFSLVLSLATLSALGVADTVLKAHVEVTGPTSNRSLPTPLPGDYTFTFGKNQATVVSPNGKLYVFDFDKKTFTSMNPAAKTVYQSDIGEVLSLSDRVQPGHRVDGTVSFSRNPQAPVQPQLAQPANPYRVLLESTVLDTGSSPGGFGAGYSPSGGLVFSGGNAGNRTSVEGRRRLEGQLWLGDTPTDLNRDQMNTTIECVLLWGDPQLKDLSKKVHDSSLAILGGDFDLRVETQRDYAGQKFPHVSIQVTSIGPGSLDPGTLAIPQGYQHVTPPLGPLGA